MIFFIYVLFTINCAVGAGILGHFEAEWDYGVDPNWKDGMSRISLFTFRLAIVTLGASLWLFGKTFYFIKKKLKSN